MIGEYITDSPEATEELAQCFADQLTAGSAVALIGELGAGKTCFVRGLARGLSIPPTIPVTSPSFTVLNTYAMGRLPLYHFDLYRLSDYDELEAVGFRDYVDSEGIAVVEWADRIDNAMPIEHWEVVIRDGLQDNQRVINIGRYTERV